MLFIALTVQQWNMETNSYTAYELIDNYSKLTNTTKQSNFKALTVQQWNFLFNQNFLHFYGRRWKAIYQSRKATRDHWWHAIEKCHARTLQQSYEESDADQEKLFNGLESKVLSLEDAQKKYNNYRVETPSQDNLSAGPTHISRAEEDFACVDLKYIRQLYNN